MKNYYEINDFENLYLEDSFVLGIETSSEGVVFIMDFVLTERHPNYSQPSPEENYCYCKGRIKFIKPNFVNWISRNDSNFIGKDHESDLGNIDSFFFDGDKFVLSGDWGELEISPESIAVEYE